MSCSYKKKKTQTFIEEDLYSVVLLVKSATESLRKLAHTTGIPCTTLSRWVYNKNNSNSGSG